MNIIKCGEILISNTIEFSFACIKCNDIYDSFRDYQMHILSEHIQGIFGDSFNELLEVEFTDVAPTKLSDSEGEDRFIPSKQEISNDSYDIKSKNECSESSIFDNKEDLKYELENKPFLNIKIEEVKSENEDESSNDDEENLELNKNILKCMHCDKIFDEMNTYKIHRKRSKCGKCPLCNRNYGDIWSHISKFHKEYYLERKSRGLAVYERLKSNKLFCVYCDRSFKKEGPFREHVRVHEKSLDKCKYCGKCFKGKNSLATHLRTHTGEKPYKCAHCPVAFSDNANLKTHFIIKHTAGLNAKCRYDDCDKTFKTKELRNRHERYVHEDKHDYLCLSCGISFKTSSKLNIHVKTKHIDYEDRPFKCSFCAKKYVFQRDFTYHMTSHTGEKPYRCEICLKSFRKRYSLTKHNRRIHAKLM